MGSVAEALRGVLDPLTPDPVLPAGVPAAVLVPVLELPRPAVVLTRRTESVRTHKGEISFPGGVRHQEDPHLLATALRETEEELGIPGDAFEMLGRLPPTHTVVSGYVIVPFVGLLAEPPRMRPSPIEIAEVVEMDLVRLTEVEQEVIPDGRSTGWFTYELGGHTVWGATGRIMHGFLDRLRSGGWSPEKEG